MRRSPAAQPPVRRRPGAARPSPGVLWDRPMDIHRGNERGIESTHPEAEAAGVAWTSPHFEVISLDCEITSYAPDGDSPLF